MTIYAKGTNDALPYEAVSVNGRAHEWQEPLWDAIAEWSEAGNTGDRERAVVKVERAVEDAMRLALSQHTPADSKPKREE